MQIATCLIRSSLYCLIHLSKSFTTGEIQIASCLLRPSLYCLIKFSKRFLWGIFIMRVLNSSYGGRRHLSEDSELVFLKYCNQNSSSLIDAINIEKIFHLKNLSKFYKSIHSKTHVCLTFWLFRTPSWLMEKLGLWYVILNSEGCYIFQTIGL